MTDAGQIASLAARVGGAPLAGLVNNAGIAVAGPLEGVPIDLVRRQYEVNVFGLLAVTQALLDPIRTGQGRIVNIGSIGGRINTPFVGPYSSSKAAVRSLSAALRRELRPWDIRVALVEPGALDTPIWRKGEEGSQARRSTALPERVRTLYARPLEALVAATRKIAAGASSPDEAAQAVEHALTAERPKAVYTVGRRGPRPGRAAQRPPRAGLRRAGGAGDEDRVDGSRGCRAAPVGAARRLQHHRGEGRRPAVRGARRRPQARVPCGCKRACFATASGAPGSNVGPTPSRRGKTDVRPRGPAQGVAKGARSAQGLRAGDRRRERSGRRPRPPPLLPPRCGCKHRAEQQTRRGRPTVASPTSRQPSSPGRSPAARPRPVARSSRS